MRMLFGLLPTPLRPVWGMNPNFVARTTWSRRSLIARPTSLDDSDWRKTNPRFTGENFQRNRRIADEVAVIAAEADATPAQVALAWLLAKDDDVAPIPGTKLEAVGRDV